MGSSDSNKPFLTNQEACDLLKEFYGIINATVKQLDSFDDCNFQVITGELLEDSQIKEFNRDGFVLKILNAIDSKAPSHVSQC